MVGARRQSMSSGSGSRKQGIQPLKTLALGLAKNLKPSGVRVNDIGLEHTPMNELTHALDCDGFLMRSR